ncbi:ferredoxin [Nocardia callitridis]|uniref:Ferredoxin n=1 Tax=Nocardia callitridis TaxID=648753 RepID=A0ABP9KVU6_9NOCA
MKISVDFDLCESNGLCVAASPQVFELDDRDFLNVLREEVTPDIAAGVDDAVRQCPRQAISLVK